MNILLRRFGGRIAGTLSLVVLEAVGWVLFPLVIGRAIDGVLAGSRHGLFELAGLGIVAMGIATTRRLVDSRAYAGIYARLGEELIGGQSGSTTSIQTARLGMLRETVEFFENSVPALVRSIVELGGPILILSALSRPVFYGCLAVLGVTAAVYALTGRITTRYNRELNDEHERQVDAVESGENRADRPTPPGGDALEHQAVRSRSRHLWRGLAVPVRSADLFDWGDGREHGRVRRGLRHRHVRVPVHRIRGLAAPLLPAVASAARDIGPARCPRGEALTDDRKPVPMDRAPELSDFIAPGRQ